MALGDPSSTTWQRTTPGTVVNPDLLAQVLAQVSLALSHKDAAAASAAAALVSQNTAAQSAASASVYATSAQTFAAAAGVSASAAAVSADAAAASAALAASLAGNPPDGDKGDITITLGVWQIDAGVVSFDKIQLMTTDRLLGRDSAGTGEVEQLAVAGGIEFSGSGGIRTSAFTGDVTKAAGGTVLTIAALAVQTSMIADDAVSFAKMQNISTARLLGRVTAASGDIESLTGTQATTLLDTFTSVLKGLVPASGGGTVNFLRADGAFAAPTGEPADADKGDITVAAGVWTIDPNVVTYAKLQDVSATDRLLGRDTAAAGDAEELTVGGGIEFTGSGGIRTTAFTGDVTKTAGGTALTIAANAVTNAMLADVPTATFKGRTTAATGDPEDLTVAQATALLDVFTSTLKGLAPSSGGGTTNFLRADATWAVPPGTGGVPDGDKTDITVSGSGTVWTVDNDVVTYAKMQNVSATDKLLGRSTAGAGDVEEIACTAAGRALLDDADAAAQRTTLGLGAVAVLASIATANIDNDAVTYAKMQNVSATDKLLGRSTAGAGDVEEIACTSAGRALLDDADASTQLQTLGTWRLKKKTANQTKNSDTTLADDSELTLSLSASTKYHIRLRFFYDAANATMDFKFATAFSGTVTGTVYSKRKQAAPTASGGTDNETTAAATGQFGSTAMTSTSAGLGYVEIEQIIQVNGAGTWSFQWAQNTSDAGNLIGLGGSYIEYMEW